MKDLIRELGPLALASRLKRISDRLYRDVSQLYSELDVEMEARWFPLLHLLANHEALAVTDIAARVGMTHPAVHQIASSMSDAGLLESNSDKQDLRRRLLNLSPKGERIATALLPVWASIHDEVDALLVEFDAEFLTKLDRLEACLDNSELYDRVKPKLNGQADAPAN